MARLIASWFGSGFLPGAPGTWGSLAALPFAWLIVAYAGTWPLLAAANLLFFIGWIAAHFAIRGDSDHDPGWIVIDEVVGQWITLVRAAAQYLRLCDRLRAVSVFDIWKPWPIRTVERRCGGGFGIMIDDVLAAVYALIVIGIGRWLLER